MLRNMLKHFHGATYIERVHHLILNENSPQDSKQQCATDAVSYLQDIGFTKSPYWDILVSTSGMHNVKECEEQAVGEALAIQKAIAHKYTEAISTLEALNVSPLKYYEYLEKIVRLLVLAKNYKGLEELDYRLNALPANYDSMRPEEIQALRRLKLIICSSFYLRGGYFSCCKSFFKLLDSDADVLRILSEEQPDPFITNGEVILMITISTILAIPFDNYDDFLHLQHLEEHKQIFSRLIDCLKLLINTSFGRFLDLWNEEFDKQCKQSMFLSQRWSSAKYMMRCKIYFFYLRISNKVEISYLSRTLHIEVELIEREIEHLIKSAHLNFELNGDLVTYSPKHYLQDVAPRLKKNQELLEKKLEVRRLRNQQLKDVVQEMIVKNNEQRVEKDSTTNESLIYHASRYRSSTDNMDLDEINDISDPESGTFEIVN